MNDSFDAIRFLAVFNLIYLPLSLLSEAMYGSWLPFGLWWVLVVVLVVRECRA